MLNSCVSYLVAPHNLTYDKKTKKVYGRSKDRVIGDCDRIIKKYDDKWTKKMNFMSLSVDSQDGDDDQDG